MPLPPPPAGVQTPPMWGLADHVESMFQAARAKPTTTVETVEFGFASVEAAVQTYGEQFGPFVMVHSVLGSEERWNEFLSRFDALVRRFNTATDGTARIHSSYFVISIDR